MTKAVIVVINIALVLMGLIIAWFDRIVAEKHGTAT